MNLIYEIVWDYILKWILLFISVSEVSKYFKSVIKHYLINLLLIFFLTTSLILLLFSIILYFLYAKVGMLIINNLFNGITILSEDFNVI